MIRIDKEKCTGCLTCLSVCPFTVLEEVDGKPQLAEGKSCMACMHCAVACTEKAIFYGKQPAVLDEGELQKAGLNEKGIIAPAGNFSRYRIIPPRAATAMVRKKYRRSLIRTIHSQSCSHIVCLYAYFLSHS